MELADFPACNALRVSSVPFTLSNIAKLRFVRVALESKSMPQVFFRASIA